MAPDEPVLHIRIDNESEPKCDARTDPFPVRVALRVRLCPVDRPTLTPREQQIDLMPGEFIRLEVRPWRERLELSTIIVPL